MKVLLSPRWLAGHLLALVLAVLFINFGFWQLGRHADRQASNALLEARLAAEPLTYQARVESAEDDWAYRRATVRGRYAPEHEVLLRSRARDGQPGYHVLTPLLFEEGRALLIDRGWVPYDVGDPPVTAALPPEGEVELSGILFPRELQPEGPLASLVARDPAEGELKALFYVDTERLERQLPYALEPRYLSLEQQTPPQVGQLPLKPLPPRLDGGPHLGYAIQWFAFALIGLIGYPLLLRQVLREARKPSPAR